MKPNLIGSFLAEEDLLNTIVQHPSPISKERSDQASGAILKEGFEMIFGH